MKCLMVVINVGAEDGICAEFLPWWRKSGYHVWFSSPADDSSRFGPFITGHSYDKGRPQTWHNYQSRVLETMKLCQATDYEAFCITQYDSVAFGPLPVPQAEQCITNIAGGGVEGLGKFFVHPPWMFGRMALQRFIAEADKHPLTMCKGIMDFWMAAILDSAGIPITDCGHLGEKWAWTHNSIDTPEKLDSAREFYKRGGLFLHGVKNGHILNQIIA